MQNEIVNKLNPSENRGVVVGKLKSKKIDFKQTKDGRGYAMGTLSVQVEDKHGIGEVRVKVMQMAKRKDGGDNGLYKALQTINDEYKTIETHGESIADTVSIDVSLEDNSYYAKNEDVVREYTQLRAGIIKRMESDAPHCAKMQIGGFIQEITPQADSTLKVRIIGITYKGEAMPVELEVPKELSAPFGAKYYQGCTTALNYAMVNTLVIDNNEDEAEFGEGLGIVVEKRIKKNLVFGGAGIKPIGYKEEEIQNAMKMRSLELNRILEEGRAKNPTLGGANNGGFGDSFAAGGNGSGATGFNPTFGEFSFA